MLDEATLYLSIRELGERIRKRVLSPVELTEAYLGRSRLIGPKLNAYATLTPELAMQQARAAEREIASGHYRGSLHGIPYAPKDLVAVRGYPTTWGAAPFAHQIFDYDATIIGKLNAAGAVMIGKAAMIELAGGLGYTDGNASLTGPTRNPWKKGCWTCGSSSGSGAVVAAGLAAFSIGSDTRGSIICPSAWCGVSGMRPTFGRVSRHGAMTIAWSMDKLGPMARSADDCGLILSVIAGHDPNDHESLSPGVAEFRHSARPEFSKPLRIGRLTNAWPPNSALESVVDAALKALEKNGAEIRDAKVPEGPFEDVAELTILMESASAFREMIRSGSVAGLRDPLGQINGYVSEEFSSFDYLDVQRIRTILQKRIDKLFDEFEVLAAAGSNTTAELLAPPPGKRSSNEDEDAVNQAAPDGISSLCGLPAICVPCGFNRDNLPYGLQFLARARDDRAAIDAARLYQSVTNWHEMHPKLDG